MLNRKCDYASVGLQVNIYKKCCTLLLHAVTSYTPCPEKKSTLFLE